MTGPPHPPPAGPPQPSRLPGELPTRPPIRVAQSPARPTGRGPVQNSPLRAAVCRRLGVCKGLRPDRVRPGAWLSGRAEATASGGTQFPPTWGDPLSWDRQARPRSCQRRGVQPPQPGAQPGKWAGCTTPHLTLGAGWDVSACCSHTRAPPVPPPGPGLRQGDGIMLTPR